ncbi:MAG: HAD hydrolase family protein [Deltaproteobacteria bacterium]|nr:HAD hydrolase family protein [Deltaproteobacteria bacterium]
MLEIEIPGFGPVRLAHLVSDFTGTLSVDGELLPGLGERLKRIAALMTIHILTADTFGRAREALQAVDCRIKILTGEAHDVQKEVFVRELGPEQVVAFGNGNNDRLMLKLAKIGIAVSEAEGCAVAALLNADIHVGRAVDGLDLLLNPKRCKATLRF